MRRILNLSKQLFSSVTVTAHPRFGVAPTAMTILSKSCPHGLTHILDRNIPPCPHMRLNLCQESLAVYQPIRKRGSPLIPPRPAFLSSLLTVLLTAGPSHPQSSPGGRGVAFSDARQPLLLILTVKLCLVL